jgi:hypothetical protein
VDQVPEHRRKLVAFRQSDHSSKIEWYDSFLGRFRSVILVIGPEPGFVTPVASSVRKKLPSFDISDLPPVAARWPRLKMSGVSRKHKRRRSAGRGKARRREWYDPKNDISRIPG